MSVTLRKRKNTDGSTSLRLDIYHNGKRWPPETLKNLRLSKPSSLEDRAANKEKMQLAEKIRDKRAQELEASNYSVTTDEGRKTVVTEWMQSYIDSYTKKDKKNMQGVQKRFVAFLIKEKMDGLTFASLTDVIVERFQDYNLSLSIGEGSSSYFSRFKKMIKNAKKQKIIKENPAADVRVVQGKARKKDPLTMAEIKLLSNTPVQSPEVRRAFLFCCLTGLRWVDVKDLKWESIRGEMLDIRQSKTTEDMLQPLNTACIKLIGERKGKKELIFKLPSANGANKTIKAWIKRAGIDKDITWHNARHSAGTNMIINEVDILTASKMLGHKSTKHTYRYVDTAKELKEAASKKLDIDLG